MTTNTKRARELAEELQIKVNWIGIGLPEDVKMRFPLKIAKEYVEKLRSLANEVDHLREELNWYQVEAVARTNTDGRTKP